MMEVVIKNEDFDLVAIPYGEVADCFRGVPVDMYTRMLVEQFMSIRNEIWVRDHGWEENDRDCYDLSSTFLLLVKDGVVLAGCRLIHDICGLPIRELVGEAIIPSDSVELSRFCVAKNAVLPRRRLARLLVQGITVYTCRLEIAGELCAVLRDSLILLLKNFGVHIELITSVTARHRLSSFSPVIFNRWQTADNLHLPVTHTAD